MWWIIASIILVVLLIRIIYLWKYGEHDYSEHCALCRSTKWFKKEMCEGCIYKTGNVSDLLER